MHCIFVDNGVLRKDEASEVLDTFGDRYSIDVRLVDASTTFLERLAGVEDPEEKRKIIGRTFIEIFEEQAKKVENATFLAQGTIYPDRIESASVGGPSATIKTHHNVGGLPERMNLELVEPLRDLFKDEVRKVGRALGLDAAFVERHPFPGPGLAVRILGEVTRERVQVLQEADAIFIGELRQRRPLRRDLPGVRRAAARQDGRRDGGWAHLRQRRRAPCRGHDRLHDRGLGAAPAGLSGVVYDVTSKPPGTIEWE